MPVGVNDTMAFVYTYWGDFGRNYNFPSFDGRIPSVRNADEFWREYFRHMMALKLDILRFSALWDFGAGLESFDADYLNTMDAACKWAERSGVRLIPSLMHGPNDRQHLAAYLNPGTAPYENLVSFERTIMAHYDAAPAILMWDVFNEADITARLLNLGWGPHTYRTWATRFVADIRDATTKPITLGHAGYSGGVWPFTRETFIAMNDIPGVTYAHSHRYATAEDYASLIGIEHDWAASIGRKMFWGEFGWNARSPEGWWPWFAANVPAVDVACALTLTNSGRGALPGYPWQGPLPEYPPAAPVPPPAPGPSPVPPHDHPHDHPHTHEFSGRTA